MKKAGALLKIAVSLLSRTLELKCGRHVVAMWSPYGLFNFRDSWRCFLLRDLLVSLDLMRTTTTTTKKIWEREQEWEERTVFSLYVRTSENCNIIQFLLLCFFVSLFVWRRQPWEPEQEREPHTQQQTTLVFSIDIIFSWWLFIIICQSIYQMDSLDFLFDNW